MGLRVAVQSEKDPKYVETRVDSFLAAMSDRIRDMPDAEFEAQRKGLKNSWTEALKNLSEETSRFWVHISSGYLDFYRRASASLLHSFASECWNLLLTLESV